MKFFYNFVSFFSSLLNLKIFTNRIVSILLSSIFFVGSFAHAQSYKNITLNQKEITSMGLGLYTIDNKINGVGIPFSATIDFDPKDGWTYNSSLEVVVVNIYKREGESVKKGDNIIEISSNELNNLFYSYQDLLSKLEVAKETEKKDKWLLEQGVISRRVYNASYLAKNELQIKLKEIQAIFLSLGIDVKKPRGIYGFVVKSYGDGILSVSPFAIGQKVHAFTPFIRISKSNKLLARIRIPLDRAENIKAGHIVYDSDFQPIGKVESVSVTVNRATNTMSAVATLTNSNFKVGEIIDLYLSGDVVKDAFVIPQSCVIKNGDDYLVFVQNKTGFMPLNIEILSEGSSYFIAKSSKLALGMKLANGAIITLKGIVNNLGDTHSQGSK